MTITLVAAVAANGVIGTGTGMPWHLAADLKHFRELTMGHPMIMGRRTFDSIGRALPGRTTVVITRDPWWTAPGVTVAHSLDQALAQCAGQDVMVVGGGEIYAAAMPVADRLEITHVDGPAQGSIRFPEIDPEQWERVTADRQDGFTFAGYRRRAAADFAALPALLAGLSPHLRDGDFFYAELAADDPLPPSAQALVAESEGRTVVVDQRHLAELSDGARSRAVGPFGWITLQVQSSLSGVGLTAAFAAALARDGIACNVLAGSRHDHLLVPRDRAGDALAALAALAA